ncbi:MAG TPA: hypothetical protein VGP79_06260 [Bryobacteraceae bacterium]|nr:hypothetical protein [Bryobacteraceae bacterium]
MALIAIMLCLVVLTVALRRVHGPKYWMVGLVSIALSNAILWWFSRGEESPISTGNQVMGVIFLCVIPMSLGFATGNVTALRSRPWLTILVVPLVVLAAILVDMTVGVNLHLLQP